MTCALLGRPDDGDPAAAAKLEEAADGSGEQRLTHDFVGGSWSSWSPDGRRIAFSGSGGIYVINADGTGLKRLTKNEVWDQGPIWSPDGRKIAFYSERDGNGEIYVMNADGSDPRNVSHSGTRGSGLFSWSPR
jgi:TolB protein